MFWVRYLFYRSLPFAAVIGLTLGLRSVLNPWLALLVAAVVGLALAGLGALLLRTARVGEVTWRNRAAGMLLPWGFLFCRAGLPGMVVGSSLVWTALAGVVLLGHAPAPAAPSPAQPVAGAAGVSWWLVAAWILNGACLLYTVSVLIKNWAPGVTSNRSLVKVVGVLALLLVGSIVLHLNGFGMPALLVAAGPTLGVGGVYLLFVAAMVLFGRNARWN
ncbi:MAG: hypothetical protein JNL08_13095 [Planctomycetes bacterium]|nr:hypothetical protein [Planctomycetota bacterium]